MINKISIEEIAKKYNLKLIVVFGSYGTERYNDVESDIDIAILSCGNNFEIILKDLLRDLMIYFNKGNIDIVNLKTANLLLKQQVAENGKKLYEKEQGLYDSMMNYYLKLFMENSRYYKEYIKETIKELKETD